MSNSMQVAAYDANAITRPYHQLDEGDIVEWKRDGSRGFQFGRVTALVAKNIDGSDRRAPIRISPLDAQRSATGARERWIGRNSVMRIFDSRGIRKQPTKTEYEDAKPDDMS